METFEFSPMGYFNLINQSRFFENCSSAACHGDKIVVSFPVEGFWGEHATVVFKQDDDQSIKGSVIAKPTVASAAFQQALSIFSLDVDDSQWAAIGQQDHVIGNLQKEYDYVRPTLFHSPYEAAAAFVIGNRMSIAQRRTIMQDMAEKYGHGLVVDGVPSFAFPGPEALLKITRHPGLNDVKMSRLHHIAHAALDGILNRNYLRSLPIEMALNQLKSIPGIGEFYAQAILYRGAGIVNDITQDDLTPYAMQMAYHLNTLPDRKSTLEISSKWAPYRMWGAVLLHIWLRREVGLPKQRTFIAKA